MSKIGEAIKLFQEAKEVKELVDLLIPEIYPYLERSVDGITDLKIRAIERYEAAGFSREDAIFITVSTHKDIIKSIQEIRKS